METFLKLPRYAFNRQMLEDAPNEQGVYALFLDDELIYLGYAQRELTIRTCLLLHHDGTLGACTRSATQYTWEITRWSAARLTEILLGFSKATGRDPRCQGAAA